LANGGIAASASRSRTPTSIERRMPTNAEEVSENTPPAASLTNGGVVGSRNSPVQAAVANAAGLQKPGICKVPSIKSVGKNDEDRRTPQRQQAPSRIPKPSTPCRHKAAGESLTLEDLDDQRLLKLTTKRGSGSPQQQTRYSEERSSTPSAIRLKSRSNDDFVTSVKREDLRGRAMLDKRTLRRLHRETFKIAIREWQEQHTVPSCRVKKNAACQVFVRMRPMFEKEVQSGEFISVSVFEEWGEVVVHNCLLHADLQRMFVHHQGFCFPHVFGPDAKNEHVYAECGASLVKHAISGQLSTIFMFGQTGSGKTYTMNAILNQASCQIFSEMGETISVKLKVFEIAGKKCSDLLSKQPTELRLLDNEDGRTNIVGATEAPVSCTDDFLRLLREAFSRRATASHGRNEESSRSHLVSIIDLPDAGSLILVDCAGTERRQDTDQHTAERTRESAEINTSLHALKECIRSRCREQRQAKTDRDDDKHRQVHVPYRDSYLTRVLQDSFTRPGSYLAAIGTVSPPSLDTEHTLCTLRTLQQLTSESGHSDAANFEVKIDIDAKNPMTVKGAGVKRNVGTASAPLPPHGLAQQPSRKVLEST